MRRELKIIEINKPDPKYVREVLARAFIRTYGAEKVKAALELREKIDVSKKKDNE